MCAKIRSADVYICKIKGQTDAAFKYSSTPDFVNQIKEKINLDTLNLLKEMAADFQKCVQEEFNSKSHLWQEKTSEGKFKSQETNSSDSEEIENLTSLFD